jgi:hypothetical protein
MLIVLAFIYNCRLTNHTYCNQGAYISLICMTRESHQSGTLRILPLKITEKFYVSQNNYTLVAVWESNARNLCIPLGYTDFYLDAAVRVNLSVPGTK